MNECVNCKLILSQDLTSEKCHMADRPSASTSRVGRPRTKSVHQSPCVPVGKPKVGRPRSMSAHTSKITDSSRSTKVKKTPGRPSKQVKVVPPPEQRVIEIDSDNSDIEFPFHPERLPDLPLMEPDQPNLPADQQNQGANQPSIQEQPNQEPNQAKSTSRCPHGKNQINL